MPKTPAKVTAAINAIPGMTKINHIYRHPSSDLMLWWFDCESRGGSVVGFAAHGTMLMLMDVDGSKEFVDPNEVEGMFAVFPNESIQSASVELANIVSDLFPKLGGAA